MNQRMISGNVIRINNYFWDLWLLKYWRLKSWLLLKPLLLKKLIFYDYFNCILLFSCANKSIISETSRSISLWVNNKANPFSLAFVIVLRPQFLTSRRDENDRSHSQVAIGKVPNSFKARWISGKTSESTLFSVTETELGKLFLNFAQSQNWTRDPTLNQGH